MTTLTQMAHTYRKLCKQVQHTEARLQKVKQQANQLNQHRNQIIQEMEHLRTLMDHCVVTGESPVQAKLSHSHQEMAVKVQEHRRQLRMDEYYFTNPSATISLNHSGLLSSLNNVSCTHAAGTISAPMHTHTITSQTHTTHPMLDEIDLSNP